VHVLIVISFIVALILFLLATFNVPSRVSLTALGLFFGFFALALPTLGGS
jgi:hypothetical protein